MSGACEDGTLSCRAVSGRCGIVPSSLPDPGVVTLAVVGRVGILAIPVSGMASFPMPDGRFSDPSDCISAMFKSRPKNRVSLLSNL